METVDGALGLVPTLRGFPSTSAQENRADISVVGWFARHEHTVVVKGAVGDQHGKMDVQLKRRAEALHELEVTKAARQVMAPHVS